MNWTFKIAIFYCNELKNVIYPCDDSWIFSFVTSVSHVFQFQTQNHSCDAEYVCGNDDTIYE